MSALKLDIDQLLNGMLAVPNYECVKSRASYTYTATDHQDADIETSEVFFDDYFVAIAAVNRLGPSLFKGCLLYTSDAADDIALV